MSVTQNADVERAVQEAIRLLGGIKRFVRPQDKVIIKPNLVFALPADTGFTTDPRVVQAIIEMCRRMNARDVTVAEGSGGADTTMAFERCGYTELAQRYDVKLVDLNKSPTTMVEVPNGKAFQVLGVPNIILTSDVLINVPKLKLFRGVRWVSMAIKNLLGAVPGKVGFSHTPAPEFPGELSPEFWTPDGKFYLPHHRQWWGPREEKKRVHTNLAEGLVDLNMVIRPSLTVIDGILAGYDIDIRTTKGEKPIELNTILASRDPLALDFVATQIRGLNPREITYLKRAAERGIGEADYSRIQVVGTPLRKIAQAWEAGLANLPSNPKSKPTNE